MNIKFEFKDIKALVVGDLMLDKYWYGDTNRISPEAPVPVVKINNKDNRPGGACNVAKNISSLGAICELQGLIGDDEAGKELVDSLKNDNVKLNLIKIIDKPTIIKHRIISHSQQLLRLDVEESFNESCKLELNKVFEKAINKVDVVVVSDYLKGTVDDPTFLIKTARDLGKIVLVDPKKDSFSYYRNATVITPNLKEFEKVVGKCSTVEIMVEKARSLLLDNNIEHMILTRGDQGMLVISKSGLIDHIPAIAREVYDVTGAGDTVVATLGVCLAKGLSILESAKIANIAAGIVIGKVGTSCVSIEELQLAIEKSMPLQKKGVMSLDELMMQVAIAKENNERIIFTNGCFDIIHAGHVLYLQQAKNLGDKLIVAVNVDETVAKLKGKDRPINSLNDRMAVLASLESVDWVVSFSEDTPEKIIEAITPDVLVKGGDYSDIKLIPGAKYVKSCGGQVQLLGLKDGCSTTNIINKINDKSKVIS